MYRASSVDLKSLHTNLPVETDRFDRKKVQKRPRLIEIKGEDLFKVAIESIASRGEGSLCGLNGVKQPFSDCEGKFSLTTRTSRSSEGHYICHFTGVSPGNLIWI